MLTGLCLTVGAGASVPSAAVSTFSGMFVSALTDGMELDQVLLVRQLERRARRDGGEYLRLQSATARARSSRWSGTPCRRSRRWRGRASRSTWRGRYALHPRFGPQINLRELLPAQADSFSPEDLLDGPQREAGQMESDLRELIATVQEPHLRVLLERVLGERSRLWASFRVAPAAKYYHQAYRHGLLEHCLSVAQAVSAISATFPGIDRDVAVTGALLHDIGKLEAYAARPGRHIDLTDLGRLHGEIALGYYRVRRTIEEIEGFPERLRWAARTSSSPITAPSSTAAPSSRARARRRWCT